MQHTDYDIAIIGAGIIGLATGMKLASDYPNLRTIVLEKESQVALHQTGHNSGVIHAGIYYAPGSQKANFCSTGSAELRRYCDERDIPYEMCGKLVVAIDDDEVPRLDELHRRGTANGAEGLELVGPERMREIEPNAAGVKAILSPNTGIVDFSRVSAAYAEDLVAAGGELALGAALTGAAPDSDGVRLMTKLGDIRARHVINCAGLHADRVAGLMGTDAGIRIVPFRGEYYSIRPERSDLINGLIYPVPDPAMPFLGVHFTKRISGSVEAGPNAVFSLAREGYTKTSFNLRDTLGALTFPGFWKMSAANWKTGLAEQYRSLSKPTFLRSLQRLVPDIGMDDLTEPGAGVRAQAVDRSGKLLQDFSIVEAPGAIHVLSAPSPGATSSLTISRYIVDMAAKSFGL
jgi:(S)-2-hydroxyglutarate dehydrogenase